MPEGDRVTKEIEVLRSREGRVSREVDVVADGVYVTFHIEPIEGLLDIVMSPAEYREFLVGHLYSEGIVKGPGALSGMFAGDRGGSRVEVLVELDPDGIAIDDQLTVNTNAPLKGLIQREHGSPPSWYARPLRPIEGGFGVGPGALRGLPAAIEGCTTLFEETGALHYAFLFGKDGSVLHGAHDIGRHTAIDKAIGKALIAGESLEGCALYTTGRVSEDGVRKSIRSRIPLVASRGAAIAGAVTLAQAFDLGVVGFLRRDRFNVYSGEHHICWD